MALYGAETWTLRAADQKLWTYPVRNMVGS